MVVEYASRTGYCSTVERY